MTRSEGDSTLHTIVLPMPFPMRSANVYLIERGELTLVDTGPRTKDALAALQVGLAEWNYTLADIRRLIITHAHPDHLGLAGRIIAESGARLYTHQRNLRWLTESDAEWQRYADYCDSVLQRAGVPEKTWTTIKTRMESGWHHVGAVSADCVGGLLADGDVLHCGGATWEVLHTGGHSDGLICLYQRESGMFISSDLLLADINYSPILEPPPRDGDHRPNQLLAYFESLERIERMDINIVLPGHGRPARNHRALIARQRAFCLKRRQQILGALNRERKTAYQIWETLYPALHPIDLFLGISNIVSYLDVLQKEGKATSCEVKGLDYYSRSS